MAWRSTLPNKLPSWILKKYKSIHENRRIHYKKGNRTINKEKNRIKRTLGITSYSIWTKQKWNSAESPNLRTTRHYTYRKLQHGLRNIEKTVAVYLARGGGTNSQYTINNGRRRISSSKESKYLGIVLDRKLTYRQYIKEVRWTN